MSGHTPGPWAVLGDKGCLIVDGPDTSYDGEYLNSADVHLIAAAPELLEACQGLIRMMDEGVLVRDISDDGESGWAIKQLPLVMAVKAATEAITKATGGDS